MPTPTKGPRLGAGPSHERLMLANLATSLFEHGKITTTETKARRMQPIAERLVTKAKRGDLHNRRQIQRVIRDKDVVHRLMNEIGPFYTDRPGGYTRISKTMPRKGDNAPMAVIELVPEKTVTSEAEKARKTKFAKDQSSEMSEAATAVEEADSADAETVSADSAAAADSAESAADSAGDADTAASQEEES